MKSHLRCVVLGLLSAAFGYCANVDAEDVLKTGDGQPGQSLIGYTEHRTNLPGGRQANVSTNRAMVVKTDGTGRRLVGGELVNEVGAWTQFAGWSPDGRTAIVLRGWESVENARWEEEHKAFRFTPDGWLVDSYFVDVATGKADNVTAVDRVSFYNSGLFFWPNDPKRLGFTALIGGISKPFRMDLDGRNKTDLTKGSNGFAYGFSSSPDGSRISYHENYQVYLANADGSQRTHVKTGHPFVFAPSWSPDGKWLLFVSGEHYDCHPHIVKADGTELKKLADRGGYRGVTEFLDVPDYHGGSSDIPVWAVDGESVFYTAKVGKNVELFRVTLGGHSERLTTSADGTSHYHPKPSPDGKSLAYGSKRNGVRNLYAMRLSDRHEHALTELATGHAAMHVHWQPATAITSRADGQTQLLPVTAESATQLARATETGLMEVAPVHLPPLDAGDCNHYGWPIATMTGKTIVVMHRRIPGHKAVGAGGPAKEMSYGIVLHSEDGGKTWSKPFDLRDCMKPEDRERGGLVPLSHRAKFDKGNKSPLGYKVHLHSIGTTRDGAVVAINNHGVFRSEDAGRNWSHFSTALRDDTFLHEIINLGPRLIDHPEHGLWAFGNWFGEVDTYHTLRKQLVALRSRDGGASWQVEEHSVGFPQYEPAALLHQDKLLLVTRDQTKVNSHKQISWWPGEEPQVVDTNLKDPRLVDTVDFFLNPQTGRFEIVRSERHHMELWLWSMDPAEWDKGQWRRECRLLACKGNFYSTGDGFHPGGAVVDEQRGVQHIFIYSGHPNGPAGVFRITRSLDTTRLAATINSTQR